MFNILSKLASKGNVADMLSSNTDLTDCGSGLQQISEISSLSDVAESPGTAQFGGQIGDSHTARADDVSDSHTGEVDVGRQDRQSAEFDALLVQEDAHLQEDVFLVQEDDIYGAIIPKMKRNVDICFPFF